MKLPDNLNLEAWEEWLEFRREAGYRKYKTTRTAKMLARYPKDVQARAIQYSMDLEYQGLFPENFKQKTEKDRPIWQVSEQELLAMARERGVATHGKTRKQLEAILTTH